MPVIAPTGSDDMTMNAIYKRHSFYNLGHIFAGAKHNLLAQAFNKDRRILCEICYPKGHIIWLISKTFRKPKITAMYKCV